VADALDGLWDFGDPAASERRFGERLASTDGDERLEVLTQLARAQGLQDRFAEAHQTLDQVERSLAAAAPRVRVRYLLERGRAFRSGGRPTDALPLFVQASDLASSAHENALALDAIHMVAITSSDPDEQMRWHERGLRVAASDPGEAGQRWLPTLRNNLGWALFERGRLAEALEQFRLAAAERRAAGDAKRTRIADWAVARTLRALGRVAEALADQRRLLDEWRRDGGRPPYVNEEIGECLLALGRADEARPYFAEAYALLSADRQLASSEPERLARLARLSLSAAET
jgi:tetratricopeptide (TPR) repeat protein